MEDKEIVKALECCVNEDLDCEDCPAHKCCDEDTFGMVQYVLDLINRQKAELEQKDLEIKILIRKKEALMDEVQELNDEIYKIGTRKTEELADELTKAQVEAIQDFAERLKEKATVDDDSTWWIANIDVDSIVKEMVGD